MIDTVFLDHDSSRADGAAACWSNTSLLLDAAARALGEADMRPTAGAADVEDAS